MKYALVCVLQNLPLADRITFTCCSKVTLLWYTLCTVVLSEWLSGTDRDRCAAGAAQGCDYPCKPRGSALLAKEMRGEALNCMVPRQKRNNKEAVNPLTSQVTTLSISLRCSCPNLGKIFTFNTHQIYKAHRCFCSRKRMIILIV